MRVALGSAFRNSLGYLDIYRTQANQLYLDLLKNGHELELVSIYGDCYDDTPSRLHDMVRGRGKVVERSHGGPVYGSTEHPDRLTALSYVGNGIFESVDSHVDVLVYVESDLRWDASTILALIDRLGPGVDIVAPMIWAGPYFYDIFAYRKDGDRFSPFAPYHRGLNGFTEVDSVGSCLVMKGEVARNCRIPGSEVLIGFCNEARSKGYRVWVDPDLGVRHP